MEVSQKSRLPEKKNWDISQSGKNNKAVKRDSLPQVLSGGMAQNPSLKAILPNTNHWYAHF